MPIPTTKTAIEALVIIIVRAIQKPPTPIILNLHQIKSRTVNLATLNQTDLHQALAGLHLAADAALVQGQKGKLLIHKDVYLFKAV